jgi:hypothetical protein
MLLVFDHNLRHVVMFPVEVFMSKTVPDGDLELLHPVETVPTTQGILSTIVSTLPTGVGTLSTAISTYPQV